VVIYCLGFCAALFQHLQPFRTTVSHVGQQSILSQFCVHHLHTQHHIAGVSSHTSFSTLTYKQEPCLYSSSQPYGSNTAHSLFVCMFVCFHGRPRQATDVLQPTTARFGRSNFGHQMPPRLRTRSALWRRKLELMGREGPIIMPRCRLPRYIVDLLHAANLATWYPRLYFPSEGRRAEDFPALKNPTASTGFEPANLGTRGQHSAYCLTELFTNPTLTH
jgi:hypothetical protein